MKLYNKFCLANNLRSYLLPHHEIFLIQGKNYRQNFTAMVRACGRYLFSASKNIGNFPFFGTNKLSKFETKNGIYSHTNMYVTNTNMFISRADMFNFFNFFETKFFKIFKARHKKVEVNFRDLFLL